MAGPHDVGAERDLTIKVRVVTKTCFTILNSFWVTTLLLKDGDVRRATVAAFRPLVAGATTTTDVLQRVLTREDVKRLESLANLVARRGGDRLAKRLPLLRRLAKNAAGRSPAQILGVKP